MTDVEGWLNQSMCRTVGGIALVVAAGLAVYAVSGGVLRDSVIHLVRFFSSDAPEAVVPEHSVVLCAGVWLLIAVALLTSIYMAMLDIRFIRLRLALERQELFRRAMEDEELRRAMLGDSEKKETD